MKIHAENFIEQMINKNEKALEYVINEYGWLVKSIIKKHLYNLQNLHEECINDVLLAVWNNIKHYSKSKNSFQNWLGAITKYKCIDYKRKYLKILEQKNIDLLDIESKENIETDVLKNELSEELESLISNLNNKDRELFMKIYVEEKKINEISKEMNMKRSIIYNRLSRARKKLKNIFIPLNINKKLK